MYTPLHFAEKDVARLHQFIEQNSFGLLVTQTNGSPVASHLPFLLDRSVGERGAIVGHMAPRKSAVAIRGRTTALVIFSGPHAYISPHLVRSAQDRADLELHSRSCNRPG